MPSADGVCYAFSLRHSITSLTSNNHVNPRHVPLCKKINHRLNNLEHRLCFDVLCISHFCAPAPAVRSVIAIYSVPSASHTPNLCCRLGVVPAASALMRQVQHSGDLLGVVMDLAVPARS